MDNFATDSHSSSVVVLGGCGIGLTMKVDRAPGPGETVGGAVFASGPGGKGSNQAVGVRRLGLDVDLCSAVGRDSFADDLRSLWRAEGVGQTLVHTADLPTMVGFIVVDAEGENRIAIAPGALAEIGQATVGVLRGRLATASALLVSLEIPLDAAEAALVAARDAGVRTILNPAPAAPLTERLLSAVDALIPNRIEAAALTGVAPDASPDELVDGLRARFSGVVVLTLGADGALVDDRGHREHVPAVTLGPTVDTTGAGDAFCAAFTVATVRGSDPLEAARFAAAAGGFAVTRDGAVPGLPHQAELEARPV